MADEREPTLAELLHAAERAIADLVSCIDLERRPERWDSTKRYEYLELMQMLKVSHWAQARALANEQTLKRIAREIRDDYGLD